MTAPIRSNVKFWLAFSAAIFLVTLFGKSEAQILWAVPQTVTGVSDISTLGTYVDALQGYSGKTTAYTIGDTVFHFSSTHNDGVISLTPGSGAVGIGAGTGGSATTASPDYNAALAECAYVQGAGVYGDVNLMNLTVGHVYQVEVWDLPYASVLSGVSNVTLTSNQFVLGTFTATSATQTFTWTTPTNSYASLSDVALRDITSSVPEPGTYAMLLAGLGMLILGLRLSRGRTA